MVGRCGNFGLHFVWLAAAARPAASRVRGATTSEFLSGQRKAEGLVSLSQQQQHPVIDLAELVSTKAGTISVAYSLTPPHVRLSRVHSQVIHHSPSSHEQAFLP